VPERDVVVGVAGAGAAGGRRRRTIRLPSVNGGATVEVLTERGHCPRLDLDAHWQTWVAGNRGPALTRLHPSLRAFAWWLTRP
jgi:hypothetical protein